MTSDDAYISPRMRTMLRILIGAINARVPDPYRAVQEALTPPPPRKEIDGLAKILAMVGFEPGMSSDAVAARIEKAMKKAAGVEFPEDDEPPW